MSELSSLTPYAAAQVATQILRAQGKIGEDDKIAPQMMYGYAKRGRIESFKDEKGKVYFIGESFKNWLDSYKKSVRNNVDYDELAKEFMV